MATDWKHTLIRIATAIGSALLFLVRHLFALLVATTRFIALRALPATWRWLRGTAFPALHRFYLWLPHRRVVAAGTFAVVAVVVALLLWRTPQTGNPAPGESTPAKAVVLKFSPDKAAPAAPVHLTGLALEDDQAFHVLVGGQPAPAQRLRDGSIRILVPLYLGSDGWPAPPKRKQKIEVRSGDRLLAASDGGVQVTELPRAPGTTASLQRSLVKLADGYERIFDALPVTGEEDRATRHAVVAMLRGLVSEGDKSLAAVLAGSSPLLEGAPVDLELTDAILASSGAAAYLDAYASALSDTAPPTGIAPATAMRPGAHADLVASMLPQAPDAPPLAFQHASTGALVTAWVSAALQPAVDGRLAMADRISGARPGSAPVPHSVGRGARGSGGSARCRNDSAEAFRIACMMQAHALLSMYSEFFVKPTADGYANTLGLAAGLVGVLGKAVPAHAIVSSLLTVVDFTISKVSLSLLPSKLDRFDLQLSKELLQVDETTLPTIELVASNTPMTITIMDLVNLAGAVLGPVELTDSYKSLLKSVFEFAISLYQAALRQFGVLPGSAAMNGGVFTMPAKRWGPARIASDDLVSLSSGDEAIVSTREEDLTWHAERNGRTNVRVETRGAGDRSKVLQDHSLCPGCVWTGGAFGEDVWESARPVTVGIDLQAHPPQGKAPLAANLTWKIAEDKDDSGPLACTIDFGDGSPKERIADCRKTQSVRHTYPYTSRLEEDTGGAYIATISLGGEQPDGSTEVFTDWTLRGTPATGQAPVDARFSWTIPWPEDRKAPSCEFDPGDGGKRQRFDDCLAVTETEHTFEQRGSFVPALTIIDGGAKDTKTAPVSVAEEGTCDESLLKHKAWTGTMSYSHGRDFWNTSGSEHVVYKMSINVTSEMPESTRRTNRSGEDYLVRYSSPSPQGSARMTYQRDEYFGDGKLLMTGSFSGGAIRPYDENLEDRETGSMLGLTLDAKNCTYLFHVQAWVDGVATEWSKGDGEKQWKSYMVVGGAQGQGVIASSTSISGSAPFKVVRQEERERMPLDASAVAALDTPLYEGTHPVDLGHVTVTWDFRPVD